MAGLIRTVGNQVPWSENGREGELVQREGNLAAQPLFSYCPSAMQLGPEMEGNCLVLSS